VWLRQRAPVWRFVVLGLRYPYRMGSLFSGIGGLELGLERSGLAKTVWQVEQSEFCRGVLSRHWPEARRYDDVRTVGSATLEPVDVICGGFPCQDVSSAGKGAGLAGSRSGLWYQYARIIGEIKPRWCVVENVASGASRWVDTVVQGLAELGYATLPVPLSAFAVGAPHMRRRIFLIARRTTTDRDRDRDREPAESIDGEVVGLPAVTGVSGAVADAEREQLRNPARRGGWPRRKGETLALNDGTTRDAADPNVECYWCDTPPPEPTLRRVDDGVSLRVGSRNSTAELKALGNAVVPQCAEVVGWMIRELEERGVN